MKLLQKFIITILLQAIGLFILNPIFATSIENINTVSGIMMSDFCGTNIQCYEINENEYACEQNDAWITNTQSHTSSTQTGKHDSNTHYLTEFNNKNQLKSLTIKHYLYKNPDIDIYPFVGIIKIQV
jgi:hypothetical protein